MHHTVVILLITVIIIIVKRGEGRGRKYRLDVEKEEGRNKDIFTTASFIDRG